jgi:hypothetical protein
MANEREIALRALRAAGHDQAAELVEAIIPAGSADPARAAAPPAAPAAPAATPAPVAPEIPAAAVPAAVAAATPAPGQLPDGILSLEEVQRQERDGGSEQRGMSHAERMRANERFCASAEYHMKNGSI